MHARVVVAVVVVAVGCGSKDAPKPKPKAGSSGIELVDQPIAIDGGKPAGGDEVEPNNTDDAATKLAVGSTVRAKIDAADDVDEFAIEVATAGVLALDVSPIEQFDLTVELQDATETAVARSDRGGIKVREGMPNVPVNPGRYFVLVRHKKPAPAPAVKPKKGQKAPPPAPAIAYPSPVYEITASLAPPAKGFEREPDDDRGAANDLILGDPASGYLGWTGDVDAWKLGLETLSPKNAIDIEVASPESVALVVEIADGIGTLVSTRKVPRGATAVFRGLQPVIPQGAAPFHYVTIKGDRSNPETPYQVKAVEHPVGPDAEIEPDDTPEHAMAMPTDRTLVKGVWTTGDVDCYVLETLDAARKLDVALDTPNEVDLILEVLVDGKPIASSNHPGKGAAEKLVADVAANARPVIRVRSSDASATGEGAYTVTVQEPQEPPKP